jgi:hypothetical protein
VRSLSSAGRALDGNHARSAVTGNAAANSSWLGWRLLTAAVVAGSVGVEAAPVVSVEAGAEVVAEVARGAAVG